MSFDEWSNSKKKKKPSSFEEWSNANRGISKKQEEEDEKKRQAYLSRNNSRSNDEDIAPVGGNKDSWFKSGGFSDGVDGVGDFFGDLGQTVGGTVGDLGLGILKGAGRLVEGVVDLGTYGVAGVADLIGQDDFAAKAKKAAQYSAVDDWAPIKTATDFVDRYSVLGDKADMVSEGLGQVGAIILTGGVAAGAGLGTGGVAAVTTGVTGLSGMGSGMGSAYGSGASDKDAFVYGLGSGAIEAGTELLFGGLGKGVKALGVTRGIGGLDDIFAKKLSSAMTRAIANESVQRVAGNTIEAAIKAGGEGAEEVLSGLGSAVMKKLTYEDDETLGKLIADENLLEQFVVGAITSSIAQGTDFVKANKSGRDYVTGYTSSEQAVIDKEVERRVAEREKSGKRLTTKEISAIEEQVQNDMEHGQLDIDTIEEVLGGESYTAYRDTVKSEDELKAEYDELAGIKKSELTTKQEDRLAELKGMNLGDTTKRDGLRQKLDEAVRPQLEGSRLSETYRERERRGKAFEADLTKYTGKQREAVERAVNSGVLNNTYRSHELVDVLSKIEAEKGISFDYTNNAKLKETGFAVDGYTVNGFASKKTGSVTLNVQSAKAWQSVVGHEITHVLEGTESYGALRNALYAYANSKGELETRRTALTKLYQDMDADVEAELTADLAGDYLFTDKDFIDHLTGNRTLFQKIYDEIKYLWNVATGKERASMEKVKHEFDRAWKELSTDSFKGNKADEFEFVSDPEAKEYSDDAVQYSIREEAPPKETGIAYKVFYVKDGKLYPPMVANPDGADTPMGVWLNADVGTAAPPSKTGRAQVKAGGKGTQGGSGSLAFRPGWHLGDLPRASQFDRLNPETGKKELFPADFVWAEVEYAKDVDYQEEAMSYGYTENGKFRHAYAGLPRLPENGYYRYRTNPRPDTVPWVITGAMKVNRLLSDAEVNEILEKNGVPAVHRQGGDVGLEKFGIEDGGKVQYSVSANSDGKTLYTGSPNTNIQQFKVGGVEGSRQSGDRYGRGVYLTTNQNTAKGYAGDSGKVYEINADGLNIFNLNDSITDEMKATLQRELNGKDKQFRNSVLRNFRSEKAFTDFESAERFFDAQRQLWKEEDGYYAANKPDIKSANDKTGEAVIEYTDFANIENAIGNLTGNELYDALKSISTDDFASFITGHGFDGISFDEDADNQQYVIYRNEDRLSIMNPGDGDVQYSISDSDGNPLSKEQQEFFKDSKVRDENGNLLSVYHGSKSNGFNIFEYSPDRQTGADYGEAYYFTSDYEKASGYSYDVTKDERVQKYHEERKNRLDRFLQTRDEADKQAFLNVTVDGKTLDELMNDESYSTGGEVKKAYLNLTNPLIVDAGGKYYYEVYDQYFDEARNSGNDGIIVKNVIDNPRGEQRPVDVYIAFANNQIKNTDNLNPSADPDIRFSLSETVEETKDLVALHNLNADKLLKSLALGGMPMPSLAVTKAEIPHENFGEITLIFDKKTIDPKANKKNKVYSADAWTPTFPRVEYEADSEVANSISKRLRSLEGKIDDSFHHDLGRVQYGFEDYLNSHGGEEGLIQYVMDNYGLKAAYLEEQGKHIDKVTYQKEAEKGYNPAAADKYLQIMDILGVSTAEEIGKYNLKEARDNHGAELEAVYPGITKTAIRLSRVLSSIQTYLAEKDSPPKYNTVTDMSATKSAVDAALDMEGYEAWVRELFTGIEKDSGVYNNKDIFTPSGSRRTFKQTHLPVTLENIVKAMAGQNNGNAKNVSGFNGVKTLRAVTAETFKSVDQIRQRKNRLQNMTPEEADAILNELEIRLNKVVDAIDSASSSGRGGNSLIRYDNIGEILAEIGESGKYDAEGVKQTFQQYGRTVSDEIAAEASQLLYDVSQMPVNMFEAKPERVVGFDEAAAFIIPRNADVKLKQELLNRGYSIAEYDPDVEGDRQRVVNGFEQYKFSLSNVGEESTPVGSYSTPFRELALDAPVAETVTPTVRGNTPTVRGNTPTVRGNTPTVNNGEAYPEGFAPVTEEEANALSEARFDTITDADMPPEMPAPYYGDSIEPIDPFESRDMEAVGSRSVKAYMYENPEVKPFFQREAEVMLGDLQRTTKGEIGYNAQLHYDSGGEAGFWGVQRNTAPDIAELKDRFGYTYNQIEAGIKAIIEDNGKENNACSKRIEFMLNDRLLNGYRDFDGGFDIPANQEYINLCNEKGITEYNEEARKHFFEDVEQYIPPVDEEIAPALAAEAETDFPDEIAPMTVDEANAIQDAKARADAAAEGLPKSRKQLHMNIMNDVKATFSSMGYDFDGVLAKAKNLSTFATVDNTPQRVMEKALGYKEGGVLADLTVNKVAQNESAGIKWLNSYTDRKNGLIARISKQYRIKPGSKESAAAQMYAEGFYVGEKNEIIAYGDEELAMDFPNLGVQERIKGLAHDPRIRKIYDETLDAINASRARNAYPEIQKLDNYFLHFRAMDDTFSKLGLPFNPNDIRAKDLPTDLNGVTADLKPGQPYFASAMHRTGKRTSFDLLGGLERYLTAAKNQIYHIDDIQTLRALRNYMADTYGQANGLEGIDMLSEEEVQERIDMVYNSHLSTFAKFLNEEANMLAGKTALIDRGLEGIIGRRGMTFLDTVNRQVGSNMVGFNISSSLTNFLPVAQAFAKTNKFDFTKAFAQTVSGKISSIFGKSDGFTENSPVVIRRKGADRFYRTPWQKAGDAGYVLMSAVDDISTELIARTKYNELTRKGMDEQAAHFETDKWVSRLLGDRSIGQQPQLFNSKTLGVFTKFQLEVRNQLDSQFYDTIQEAKVSAEDIENGLARNAKIAAKVTSTFAQLAVAQHLYGKAFESVAGYNPAFDIISTLSTVFGFDDEEDSEDTVLDNIEQGFLALLEDLPYTSTFTGGRIPISSALPVKEVITGVDEYGNEKSRLKTLGEAAPYYVLPGGYGQIKKTAAGLGMFSDEHPVTGSYTDGGNLRFPVEDTPANRAQAAIFGQYASENAREYFDNDWAPLNEKQIQEFVDVDVPIREYREIREGLTGLSKLEEKLDYIAGLDLPIDKKNILANNATTRKEPIDLTNYEDFSSLEEFDFANKQPEKYAFAKSVGGYAAYQTYSDELYDIKADKDAAGKSISGSRKEKVIQYINNLDADYYTKIILLKSEYPSEDAYNAEIIEYLNGRGDLTYEDRVSVLTELGFRVTADGQIYAD